MTKKKLAQDYGVTLAQIIEMPSEYDACAGAFGIQRILLPSIFKIVDDLEYPLYVIEDKYGEVFVMRRTPLLATAMGKAYGHCKAHA